MPDWIFWAVGIWFFLSVIGRRGCGLSSRRFYRLEGAGYGNRRDPRVLHSGHPGWSKRADLPRAGRSGSGLARRPAVRKPQETPEERIRRRFVEGRTTLEEYEAELWEELRPK
jgi:hypothetical protein